MKDSPTGISYQDCKGVNGCLVCSGGGYLDWIDPEKWELKKRFQVGESELGSPLSREGMCLCNKKIYFLPDDGPSGKIYTYGFKASDNISPVEE